MAKATGFQHDNITGDIKMNAGDTGSFKVHCSRASGETWPEGSRMLYTIRNQAKDIVLQRIYRLDDQYGLGDGVVLIEFHNDGTPVQRQPDLGGNTQHGPVRERADAGGGKDG